MKLKCKVLLKVPSSAKLLYCLDIRDHFTYFGEKNGKIYKKNIYATPFLLHDSSWEKVQQIQINGTQKFMIIMQ